MGIWIVGAVAAIVLLYCGWTYNRMIALRKRADGAWSDIDVQLKRRWDLTPALVATVRGYADHENQTLRQATEARARATDAASLTNRGAEERNLAQAVGAVFVLAEAYPELKASENFIDLHRSLVDIENNVQYARRYHNAVVRDLNSLVASFPALLIAGTFRFTEREYFQIDDGERAAPGVNIEESRDKAD